MPKRADLRHIMVIGSGPIASRSSIDELAGKMCVVTPREASRRATLRLIPRSSAATV